MGSEMCIRDRIAGMTGPQEVEVKTLRPSMSFDTQRMLEKMNSKLGIRKLMTEGQFTEQILEESFDLDFEIDEDGDKND